MSGLISGIVLLSRQGQTQCKSTIRTDMGAWKGEGRGMLLMRDRRVLAYT